MTSPVASLIGTLHPKMCGGEFGGFFDDDIRANVLRAVCGAYYAGKTSAEVIFDTNRSWTGRMSLLQALYPGSRVICCVREIGWIIDSIERMLAKNPLQLSRIFDFKPGVSVYARAEALMNSDTGLIGLAWSTLREAWFSDNARQLILIPYDRLVAEPQATIARLYLELGEPAYPHDFDNVVYDEPDYDSHIGMPGMHKVRERVGAEKRLPCIPHDLFAKFASAQFWERAELNSRGVTVL